MIKKADTFGFHLYDKWLWNLRYGKTIDGFFRDNFYNKIAIYGMGLIGMQVLEELKDSGIQVCYGIDQNAQEKFVEGLDIIVPDVVKDLSRQVHAIVVTPIQYFFEIEKMLLELTQGTDIVSVEQIVEYIARHG